MLFDTEVEIRHLQLFAGCGGGGRGFNRGHARVGRMKAKFRCLAGIDVDRGALKDFEKLVGAPGVYMDLFDREQYTAWHGHPPRDGWKEATPEDLRRAAGGEYPDCIFSSPPCKAFSGLLSAKLANSPKYQALNGLTLRGIWLALEAFKDDPPSFFIMENVQRIAQRGRFFLDQIISLLESRGYAVAETFHDCGEIGGLAQSRRRYLLVARHREKVPPHLFEPSKTPLRAVGDVLSAFPLPEDPVAGPMHKLSRLQFRTWLKLALVEAGKDWRSLNRFEVVDGVLRDYCLVPLTSDDGLSIPDPRYAGKGDYGQLGVRGWNQSVGTIKSKSHVGGGAYSIADPRVINGRRYNNVYRVLKWSEAAQAVTSGSGPSSGGQAIADPRPTWSRKPGDSWSGGQHYGCLKWDGPAKTVIGHAKHDNGPWSVCDPRISEAAQAVTGRPEGLPADTEKCVAIIQAEDQTFHRPLTTLELAALQGLVDPGEYLEMYGSDTVRRQHVGNAVPPPAAAAVASVMGKAILLARSGEHFVLDAMPIWVRPLAISASVARPC